MTRTGIRLRALVLFPLVLLLGACGTGVFPLEFSVSLNDPAGLAGKPPVQVSIFDPTMGDTADWAGKTMGTASPGSPYTGGFNTTDTKMVFDSSPPKEVGAGLYLPSYNSNGYFRFRFSPVAGQVQQVNPGFVPWADFYPEGKSVVPPTLRIVSTPKDKGWSFAVTVDMPTAPPKPAGTATTSSSG